MSSTTTSSPNHFLVAERAWFWGSIMMTWLHGIHCFMFIYSTHSLISSRHNNRLSYIIVSSLILLGMTVYMLTEVLIGQLMWIDHRDFPGGPIIYVISILRDWWHSFGTACGHLAIFIGDGLLIYRCYVIYNGTWKAVMVPFVLYIGSVAMAFALIIRVHRSATVYFLDKTLSRLGIAWAVLSVSFSIAITILITYRILKARRSLVRNLPDRTEAIQTYTSLVAILVESALPSSIFGIAFAVIFGKDLQQQSAMIQVWNALSALSSQFIIFRIASGQAWTKRVAADVSAIGTDISTTVTLTAVESKPMTEVNVQPTVTTSEDGRAGGKILTRARDSLESSTRSADMV
ncbi:hypothetical protein C8J56DRAFT_881852 [Mycena floridula]|nr:hypothetical protein C8J56DRAFT_881852 [Mycena floridula]